MLLAVLGLFALLGPPGRTVFTHGNPVWKEYSYLGGMDAIALGSLTALFLQSRHLSRQVVPLCAALGALGLVFTLGFSIQVARLGLNRMGLGMTLIALSACLLIAAAAESKWQSPRLLAPVCLLGRRSYEVYLTHMFLVLALFRFFTVLGKPLPLIPALFLAVFFAAAALGESVARLYADPANRSLRILFRDDPARLGIALPPSRHRHVLPPR